MSGGGTLSAPVVCETVVKLAAHGRRNVGGNGSLESSSARLRFCDSIACVLSRLKDVLAGAGVGVVSSRSSKEKGRSPDLRQNLLAPRFHMESNFAV